MPKSVVRGGREVLVVDVPGARLDADLERPRGRLDRLGVAALRGLDEPLVVLHRELRVDGEEHLPLAVLRPGQPHRELHPLAALPARRGVRDVLLRREHLLEERAELHLAPCPARLHVREDLLEVADAGREGLHLAEPALHRLEPLRHELERVAEPLLERALELLVHRLAHLLEAARVLLLQPPRAARRRWRAARRAASRSRRPGRRAAARARARGRRAARRRARAPSRSPPLRPAARRATRPAAAPPPLPTPRGPRRSPRGRLARRAPGRAPRRRDGRRAPRAPRPPRARAGARSASAAPTAAPAAAAATAPRTRVVMAATL